MNSVLVWSLCATTLVMVGAVAADVVIRALLALCEPQDNE